MFKKISILTGIMLASGCATMINGTEQQLTVLTSNNNSTSTQCYLVNTFGSWNTIPNTQTKIYRDSEPLQITCKNEKQMGSAYLLPDYSNGLFVLDLIGTGLIGMIVDGANKSLYEYPNPTSVIMNDAVLRESK